MTIFYVFRLFQKQVMFEKWDDIFEEDAEGKFKSNVHIYSFDGKDVMTDNTW